MTTTGSEITRHSHRTNNILFIRALEELDGTPPSSLGYLLTFLHRERRRRRLSGRGSRRLLLHLLGRSGWSRRRGGGGGRVLVWVAGWVGGAGDGGAKAVEEGPEGGLNGDPRESEAAGDDHHRLQRVALAALSSSLRHGYCSRIGCFS
jgi:hypothetical protein